MSYHHLIARAVDGLDKNTGEARRALYERARNALIAQLGSNQPVLVLADITKERLALEEAIRKVEAEAARNLRREPRTETQDLRSAGTVGRTLDVGRQSTPPRGDRRNPSAGDLSAAERSSLLFNARDRLLGTRTSTTEQAVNPVDEVASDVQEIGQAALEAGKAARQRHNANAPETLWHKAAELPVQFSREAHADWNDLNSNDDDIQQQGDDGSAYEPEDDPVALPPRYTRSAPGKQNDPKRRQQFSYPGPPSLPRANWSLPLPRPLVVSGVKTVATLNDARVLIERLLQSGSRTKEMWTYVSNELREAALADDTEKFSSVLEMALSLEGLQWELK